MIFTERTAQPEPASLRTNAATWTAEYLNARAAFAAKPTDDNQAEKAEKERTEKFYGQPDVRAALKALFHGKCAYCESQITHIGYPQIEHFKPKGSFPELCFSWTNLLLGCAVCNGRGFKGGKFPSEAEGGPFIDPTVDSPEDHLEFVFEEMPDGPLGYFARVKGTTMRGKTTCEQIGLNRIDLLKERSRYLQSLYPFIAKKAGEGDEEALRLLETACRPDFTYSAFAKSLKRQFLVE